MKVTPVGYDLGKLPVTYDVVAWLAALHERIPDDQMARIVFNRAGDDRKVAPQIKGTPLDVPDGFRRWTARDFVLTTDRKEWRVWNLMLPLALCGAQVAGATFPEVRDESVTCPTWKIQEGVYAKPSFLRAPEFAREAVGAFYGDRPVVTVTIRDSDVQPIRNSNQAEWRRVCEILTAEGFACVVIPDTEAAMCGRGQRVWDDEYLPAAMSPQIRLAAYELAAFNLFTSGGPMMAAMFDARVRYAGFKTLVESEPACNKAWHEITGLSDGHSRGDCRRVWWCDDRADDIMDRLRDGGFLRLCGSDVGRKDEVAA